MSEQALFDMEPIASEAVAELSAGQKRTQKRLALIELGYHPLSNISPGLHLHPDAHRERDGEGPRCGGCQLATNYGWWKCKRLATNSEASDLRLWWPACVAVEPKEAS